MTEGPRLSRPTARVHQRVVRQLVLALVAQPGNVVDVLAVDVARGYAAISQYDLRSQSGFPI
jgi:hypothetical protein